MGPVPHPAAPPTATRGNDRRSRQALMTGYIEPLGARERARPERLVASFDRDAQAGLALVVLAALIYWLSNRLFDATRGDFFYLADAFLHGRTWLDTRLGFQDVIVRNGHIYV